MRSKAITSLTKRQRRKKLLKVSLLLMCWSKGHAGKILIETALLTHIQSVINMTIIVIVVMMMMMMILMMIIWLVMVPGQMERKILLMIVTLPTPMTSSSYGRSMS